MVANPKRILIVRTDRIGDVVLSTPVIRNLKAFFPQAYFAFMCRPYTRQVLEGNPYLNEVIVYDKYGKNKSFISLIKFSFYLRKKKFDWALILHPTSRAHLITFLAGIHFRIGWDRKLGFLLSRKLKHTKQEGKKHELEYTLDILRALNIPIIDKATYFPLNPEANQRIDNLLKQYGIKENDKFIVIHPSASCPSKRWPQDNFSELIKLLKAKVGLKIVLITSQEEKKYTEKIASNNEIIDLRGKLNISEVGCLLKKTGLFISNDSGPVHIAASLNTPVISIFGRKDSGLSPLRWRPLGDKTLYLHKDVGCDECLAHNCSKGFACLMSITPKELCEKAILLLSEPPKA